MTVPHRQALGYFAAFAGSVAPLSLFYPDRFLSLLALSTIVVGICLSMLFKFKEIKLAAQESALLLMGFLYVPLLLAHLILLRNLPFGIQWIFLLLIIVMCGDSAAYYSGSSLGKHKLYPAVSPKKSVEGSLGGLLGSIAGALFAKFTFFPQLSLLDCLATAVLLGVSGT